VSNLDDDLGTPLPPTAARRIVSLVPSLTEAVAATGRLVGATDFCTHPSGLDVARVGGTKWPDVDAVTALHPDLVLANAEENRPEDVLALRAAGIAVWVTYPRTVPDALASLGRMFAAMGEPEPDWLAAAAAAWADPPVLVPPVEAVIPVWRRPWVVVGTDTFAGDVLARLGVRNAYQAATERYPRPSLEDIRARRPGLVVLPDEPYAFGPDDGPESFPGVRCAFVSGRHLTWYGPSLVEAPALLVSQLRA
jgi:ABC-type Fe3+-hydroxamate transport system substrate-binding protein